MSETITTLYLMRHSEVDEAYHRKFGGTIDMELSPVGRHQRSGTRALPSPAAC